MRRTDHAERQRYGMRHLEPKPIVSGSVTEKIRDSHLDDPFASSFHETVSTADFSSTSVRSPHMVFHDSTPSVLFYPAVDAFQIGSHGQLRGHGEHIQANLLSPRKSQVELASANSVLYESSGMLFAPSIPEPELMDSTQSCKTTMMLRGVPNKYTRDMILEEFKQRGVMSTIDFFYMPFFPGGQRNVGYCFVNLISMEAVKNFCAAFEGVKLQKVKSDKTCKVNVGKVQGLAANISTYQDCAVISSDVHQPMLFKNGKPMPFPPPSNPEHSLKTV